MPEKALLKFKIGAVIDVSAALSALDYVLNFVEKEKYDNALDYIGRAERRLEDARKAIAEIQDPGS